MPHFSELSPPAQDAIVAVIMGETVSSLPKAVRDEIQSWAETDDFAMPTGRTVPHQPTPGCHCIQCAKS